MKLLSLAAASLAACLACASAKAADYALILTIDYAGTSAALPGIDKDAQLARRIAESMGVPASNIVTVQNSQLTVGGLRSQLSSFANRVRPQDNVFIYYSGHGAQVQGRGPSGCVEGMVGADLQLLVADELKPHLDKIAATAARTVVLNDSCFSGGQYREKSTATRSLGKAPVPKLFNTKTQSPAESSGYQCGEAINKQFRDLGVVAPDARNQLVYLAAASDREVAFATENGSSATLAWHACLGDRRADSNADGAITGQELQTCAQAHVRNQGFNQTVTLAGQGNLPIVHGPSSGGDSCGSTSPANLLEGIRRNAVGAPLTLTVHNPRLRIGRDLLDFSVDTPESGYLYILQVGSSGKFNVLFPNKLDSDNRVSSGTHRFPRSKWAIQAQGPQPGTNRVMALLLPEPVNLRDYGASFDVSGTFSSLAAGSCKAQKDLGLVSRDGRTSASQVERIEEVN
jgi:hypothetical protein